jgi:hypothetical protein
LASSSIGLSENSRVSPIEFRQDLVFLRPPTNQTVYCSCRPALSAFCTNGWYLPRCIGRTHHLFFVKTKNSAISSTRLNT